MLRLRARRSLIRTLGLAVAFATVSPAQPPVPPEPIPQDEKHGPAIPGIGPVGEVRQVATGFRFTEGPAADASGNLYFTDVPRSLILELDLAGTVTTFRTDTERMNGLMVDGKGRLFACQGGAGKVVVIDPSRSDAGWTVLASGFEDVRFNAPNDLVLDGRGGVYFTDPLFARQPLPQKTEGVYYIAPDGKVTRVLGDRRKPNGVSLSPDGKTLYVLHSAPEGLTAFPVEAPGKVGKPKALGRVGRGDGMTLDEKGNLYLTQPSEKCVLVLSPAGKTLGRIAFPQSPSNCTFGGKDRRTLFVTARTSLYAVPMAVRGLPCR